MFIAEATNAGVEGVVVETLKQIPAVVALIVVVWYFLRHISESEIRQEKIQEKRAEVLKELGADCHAFQEGMAKRNEAVIIRVQESLDRNTMALGRIMPFIEEKEEEEEQSPIYPTRPDKGDKPDRPKPN